MVMAPPLHGTQQCRPSSMAAWLSSTGTSHHSLLPHIPSTHLSAVNSSPHPGIAPIPKLQLPAAVPSRAPASLSGGTCGSSKDCLILIPFRLPQISCFPLSLTCFSSDSDNCPMWGLDPCFSSPTPEGRSSLTNTPVFPTSSFILLSFV